uniref:Uncharacterized protein n=1 Tax=Oryza barthii TaxID=65489 RepID=A0A0D3GGW8_9ORYZ
MVSAIGLLAGLQLCQFASGYVHNIFNLNASKGPTPDLLQLTFARARWNNPTACIAALEGVPHVTPVN